ncbi:MAG: AmmeMemoRadiSam system protein B, partial [Methylocystaceae bacterium]
IITGLNDWQTPEGRMLTDQAVVNSLIKNGLAVRDEKMIEQEHSVAGLIPLLHHYLPNARVAPVILQHEVSLNDVDALLDGLQPFMNQKAIILASVDFSHYLTRPQAQNNDQYTLKLMRNFDYTILLQLDSDYLDSPAALACAFRYAERNGIKSFQLIDNSNSGIIIRNDNMETTSYFTLVFSQ